MRSEHGMVGIGERYAVDVDQVVSDGPLARAQLQRFEMVVRCLVSPFGEVQDHLLVARYVLEELLPVLRYDVSDVRGSRRQTGVPGGLDVADQAAEMLDDAGSGRERHTLTRRRTAEQTTHL